MSRRLLGENICSRLWFDDIIVVEERLLLYRFLTSSALFQSLVERFPLVDGGMTLLEGIVVGIIVYTGSS